VPGLQRASHTNDADRLRSVLRFWRACQRNGTRGTTAAYQRGGVGAV